MNWRTWFKDAQDYQVFAKFYECDFNFSLEELYQAFKARMKAEEQEEKENSGP